MQDSEDRTGMHLAIETKKPERALILLKETGGMYVCVNEANYNVG